jgi:hypothetical protein
MRKLFGTALLAFAFAVPASSGAAQGAPDAKKSQKGKTPVAAEDSGKTRPRSVKEGVDCSPQRAGVRCSRRKEKKPWLFGD